MRKFHKMFKLKTEKKGQKAKIQLNFADYFCCIHIFPAKHSTCS